MLRDCLVHWCKDKWLQCKLLTEKDLIHISASFYYSKSNGGKDLQQHPTAPVNSIHAWAEENGKKINFNFIPNSKGARMACHRCGGKHKATDCKFWEAEGHFCKLGHCTFPEFAEINKGFQYLRLKPKLISSSWILLTRQDPNLYHTEGPGTTPPILVTLQVNGQDLTMELDIEATLSIISEKTCKSLFFPHWRGPQNIGRITCHGLLHGPKLKIKFSLCYLGMDLVYWAMAG